MLNKYQYGTTFSVTATDGTHPVASQAGVAGRTHVAFTVSCSSDKSGSILLVKDGTTTIWQEQVGAGFCNVTFPCGLKATAGNLLSAEIDSTSAGKANLCGVTI
jgi:hypothetical protein